MDDWDKFDSESGSRENQPAEKPKTYYYVNQPAPEFRPGIPQEKPKKEKKAPEEPKEKEGTEEATGTEDAPEAVSADLAS